MKRVSDHVALIEVTVRLLLLAELDELASERKIHSRCFKKRGCRRGAGEHSLLDPVRRIDYHQFLNK